MVSATVALIMLMSSTPRKLNTAAMRIAARGDMHRVTTQVAMAFGASVQPLTKMTPSVSTTATSSRGFCVNSEKKYANVRSIKSLPRSIYPFGGGGFFRTFRRQERSDASARRAQSRSRK